MRLKTNSGVSVITLVLVLLLTSMVYAQSGSYDWSGVQNLNGYPGIKLAHFSVTSPRILSISCMQIDMTTPHLKLYTTPRCTPWVSDVTETLRKTTRSFVTESQSTSIPIVAAINCDFFTPWPVPYNTETLGCVDGLAVSENTLVSPGNSIDQGTFIVSKTGVPSMIVATTADTDISNIQTAVSGRFFVLVNGVPTSDSDNQPRTGIGVSQDSRYVYFLTVDGRQAASQGCTTREVGQWLQYFGSYNGINMDGGGSTTMTWWDPVTSSAILVNSPRGDGSVGSTTVTERCVGNNIGVYYSDTPPPPSPPVLIYNQFGFGTGGVGNIFYFGGVYNDLCYAGQITASAVQLWGDEQRLARDINNPTGPPVMTGLVNFTPAYPTGTLPTTPVVTVNGHTSSNCGKSALILNGYLYSSNGSTKQVYQATDWDCTTGLKGLTADLPVNTECMCTDGTYIYMASNAALYKYSVNHVTRTFTVVSGWPKTIASGKVFRGISYYNGSIYMIDNSAQNASAYGVNCSTGAITTFPSVATGQTTNMMQIVRYGNELFAVGIDAKLYTLDISAGTWTSFDLNPILGSTDCYGIGVKGDGTRAQYAWISHLPGTMSFWALHPYSTATDLADPINWKNGYPVYAENAVVTAIGTDGFFVENQHRTVGAHVIWSGTMPAIGKLITIKATSSKSNSGERKLTASEITEGDTATPAIKPLFVTNKSLGPATASANWLPPDLSPGLWPGLANDGMLVTVCGKVTGYNATSGAFYIDDGSGVPSDVVAPAKGVKILKADGSAMTGVTNYATRIVGGLPSYAVVTGIVRLDLVGSSITRRIDARSNADIVITAL